MAVEVISAVERNRDVLERRRVERAISERAQVARDRTETQRADAAQQKIVEDARIERDRTDKLQADQADQRVQLRNETERKRLLDLDAERETQRIDARRRDDLDRLQQRDARQAAQALVDLEAERARTAGIEAYRAQVAQLTALQSRFALAGVQTELGNNVPAQLAQLLTPPIDQVDLSEIAQGRLQGIIVGSPLNAIG